MTALDVLRFAARALGGHRLRTSLSLLGVAIGVAAVVLLTSLGEGARTYVTREFAALGSNLLIVTPGRTETTGLSIPMGGAPHDLTLADADALRRVPGQRRIAPMALGGAVARAGDLTRDTIVVGVTNEWQALRRIDLQAGRFLPEGDANQDRSVCVIGATIQRELFPTRSALGATLRLGDERFRVIGVLSPRGTNLGMNLDDVVLIPIARHMRMFDEASVQRILVEMQSAEAVAGGKPAVLAVLTARHDGEEDVTVVTQESMLATFSRLLAMLTAALTGIAAISLSVAGVGIMNVMLVSVSERTHEIGLLKALGATSSQVLRLFLTEASALSAIGGVAGLIGAGLLSAAGRTVFPSFPIHAPGWAMPAAVLLSVAVGVLFGVLPARRAARLDPIDALARR